MVILVLCWLCFPIRVHSINYKFSHYDVNNGLSQNSVLSIMQDDMGFMWFGTRNGLCRFDGSNFKIYRSGSTVGLKNNRINVLHEGPHNEIWIGTERGAFIYSPTTDTIRPFSLKASDGTHITGNVNIIVGNDKYIYLTSIGQGVFVYDIRKKTLTRNALKGKTSIFSLAVDKSGDLWVGFYQDGLCYSNDNLRSFHPVTDAKGQKVLAGKTISGIDCVSPGIVYMCSNEEGLAEYDIRQRMSKSLFSEYNGRKLYAHAITSNNGFIYMSTETGLAVYHPTSGERQFYKFEVTDPFSLSDDHLQTVYFDRAGGIWIGTYFGGVNYSPGISTFNNFFPRVDVPTSLFGRRVHQMDEDVYGRIWIGTEDNGFGYLNPANETFHRIDFPGMSPNVQSLSIVNGNLWVGTFQEGISIIDLRTLQPIQHIGPGINNGGLNDANVFTTYPLHDGRVAIGTFGGLNFYHLDTKKIETVDAIPRSIVYAVLEDRHYNLWVAVYDKGIYMLPYGKRHWVYFDGVRHQVACTTLLFEDSRGVIWASTDESGLRRFDPGKKTFSHVTLTPFNSNGVVESIVEDRNGNLWMGTNEGLLCYDPVTQKIKVFNTSNGLLDNTFSSHSALCSRTGLIYMGSQSGLTSFMPNASMSSVHNSPIVATELYVNGQLIDNMQKGSPIKECITMTKKLVLSYKENSFAIRVAMLSYKEGYSRQIQYKLDGFDKNWQQLYNDNFVRYTNLPPGHYHLLVKDGTRGSNSRYTLEITVRHPWWSTWWAILCYLLLGALVLWFIINYLNYRSAMHRDIAIRKVKYETQKELYQSKIKFFTSVAHEIRTPVTLIKGPLTDILHRGVGDEETKESLNIMNKNVNRLLDLINQLLDFRKAETAGLKLNRERCNISDLLEGVTERFRPMMKQRNMECRITLPSEPLIAYVDKECFTKIISNLLLNAVKYGDKLISIELMAVEAEKAFQVVVSNDGEIIPVEKREKIFKPFFRAETNSAHPQSGTGIGLAIARSMTELHQGHLHMEERHGLNAFIIYMPMGNKPTISLEDNREEPQESNAEVKPTALTSITNEELPTVLIVEDNKDMLRFEVKHISNSFQVLTATNGEEAIKVLSAQDVDIIVSDVMMQPMDGFELCQRVKTDINTSHIPIILLSALAIDSAKVKGLEEGADYYIEKPFSMEYLITVIKRLLKARKEEKQAFASSPSSKLSNMTLTAADKEFAQKLEKVVDENLIDENFGINELASKMFMSRTNLNRKIKGVFNLTPNNYIKMRRLKKAAYLMKEHDYKVNEVAALVGFASPSYFTQCFQKQFGMLPKDFIMNK